MYDHNNDHECVSLQRKIDLVVAKLGYTKTKSVFTCDGVENETICDFFSDLLNT